MFELHLFWPTGDENNHQIAMQIMYHISIDDSFKAMFGYIEFIQQVPNSFKSHFLIRELSFVAFCQCKCFLVFS